MAYDTTLTNKETVAEKTLAVQVTKPDGFTFKPGQHVDLAIENPRDTDELGATRTLSIASAPHEAQLTLATRLRDTAFKRELAQMEPGGGNLSIDGPFGNMTLHSRAERPAVFLAGGIGVTPFVSMIRHAMYQELPHAMTLFYSCRQPADALFLDELREAAHTHERLQLVSTMTGEVSSDWAGESRRIDGDMLRDYLDDVTAPIYYIAGPPQMVKGVQQVLDELGVEEDDVRFEEFGGY